MKKFKDLVYNCSDIIVTVLIVLLALGVIFWRVQCVMGYSSFLEAKKSSETKIDIDFEDIDLDPDDNPIEEEDPEEDGEDVIPDTPVEEYDVIDESFKSKTEVEVTIVKGSGLNKACRAVADAYGLSDDKARDLIVLLSAEGVARGADKRVKVGTFTIPEGSTILDILKIISNI